MKAYVIKDIEGEYLSIKSGCYTSDIRNAKFFKEKSKLLDGIFTEITIAEGNLEEENQVLKRALELACEKLPMSSEYCCVRPERYNLQDEYGSDEPYWVEEGGCEFADSPEHCLDCVIAYFIKKAEGEN